MKKTLAHWILLASLGTCGVAHAQVADFSGPSLGPGWTDGLPPNFSYVVGGGELRVSLTHDGSSNHNASGGVSWHLGIPGDYAIRVTVDVSQLVDAGAGAGFMNGGLMLFTPAGASFVGPWRNGNGAAANAALFLDVYDGGPSVDLPSTLVDILVERRAGTVFQSIATAGSGDYRLLRSTDDPRLSGPTSLQLNLYYGGMAAVQGASIGYSGLSVTIPAVPEPPLAMLLAGGLAFLALRKPARVRGLRPAGSASSGVPEPAKP